MIKDYLKEELIMTDVTAENWRDAASMAGSLLLKADKIQAPFIDSMIRVVENYGPYMILVPGVCFFHGEPGDLVKEVCLSLCVFNKPIYFDDFDNQEIRCAFAFGAKDKDSHMNMLVSVTSILQDAEFIKAITNNYPKEKIMSIIQKY